MNKNSGGKIKIACVGDSITRGTNGKSYPEYLQKLLGSDYEVMNFGQGGTTAQTGGYMRLPEVDGYNFAYVNQPEYRASLASEPDIVIIMFGTNDTKMQNWFYDYDYKNPHVKCSRSKAEVFYSDYKALVQKYIELKTHPKVIFATSCVVFDDWVGEDRILAGDHILGETAEAMAVPIERKIASELDVYLVDIYDVTKKNKENGIEQSLDGLHPDLAYDKLAAEFAKAVKALTD